MECSEYGLLYFLDQEAALKANPVVINLAMHSRANTFSLCHSDKVHVFLQLVFEGLSK